jgi:hypothetical protein
LIGRGALRFEKERNDHRIVTFHDSCNVARGSRMGDTPGGQFTIPRDIVRAVANHYHDMAPGSTHEATFCCGGGGGLLTDDLMEIRVKGALPRMESLQQVVDAHGVNFMATICAICKAQFSKVLPYYGFDMSMVGGVHQLVSTAIRTRRAPTRRGSHGTHRHPGRRHRGHARSLRDARKTAQAAPRHRRQRGRLLPVRALQPLGRRRLALARRGLPEGGAPCSSARASASCPRR